MSALDRKPLAACAVSEVTTPAWTFEQDVAGYAAGGWGAIGVWLSKLAPGPFEYRSVPDLPLKHETIEHAAAAIRAAGLAVSSVICSGGFTHPDPEARRRNVDHARHAIEAARRLGSPCLLILPGVLHGTTRDEAMRLCANALAELAPEAADAGVRLAVEAIDATQTDFGNRLSDAIELAERVDHPGCGVFLDTWQLWAASEPLSLVARCAGRIFGTHVADAVPSPEQVEDRRVPGEGEIPLATLLQAITDAGFDGFLEVELISRALARSDHRRLLARCAAGMAPLATGLRQGPAAPAEP